MSRALNAAGCILLMVSLSLGSACRRAPATTESDGTNRSATGVMDGESGFVYAAARWRLATFADLDRATVWVSHIAIRHEQSDPSFLRALDWRPDPPNPKRNIADALSLAQRIAKEAAADPQNFAALARKYSEDTISRDRGGALGGVRVSQLAITGMLDAIAALKPGQVSQAFRTPYGFHIVKREAPPPEEQLAGERIVIGYESTLGQAREARRNREQARVLAAQVAAEARANPEAFKSLVVKYSDHADRAQFGDMGVFSSRDPEYLPVEIAELSRLRDAEISDPIDSRFGFEILKRVKAEPRAAYAMTAIELRFDPTASEGQYAHDNVLALANQIRLELDANPARFEELQKKHCCTRVQRWTRGRGPLGMSDRLDALALGEIAASAMQWDEFLLIPKRLDPASLPAEPPRSLEVPNPAHPDFDALIDFNDPGQIAEAARSLAQSVSKQRGLPANTIDAVVTPLTALAAQLDQPSADSSRARSDIYETIAVLKTNLGAEQFAQFRQFATRWAVDRLMPPIMEQSR
ncbi:MAG: peptidylprolyl isomerase [Myxococcota bacterium]